MTKEEFVGFSSAAQHDMVLEALVRVTKNLETMEKESGKPFVGTAKQRRNDIKLLTILAEAFGKNELVWDYARMYKNGNISKSNYKARCDECMARGYALYTGIGHDVYMEKSKPEPWDPAPNIEASIDNRKGSRNVFSEMMNAKEKIESTQQRSGRFMSCENNKES